MKRVLALLLLAAAPALASEECPSTQELWDRADLVALGRFEPSLQPEPVLHCTQENLAYSFGQCPDEMRALPSPNSLRVPFRLARILKINRDAAGSYIELNMKDGERIIDLPLVIVQLYGEGNGAEGILFAKEKTPLNDFRISECAFIDRERRALEVESLLQAHPGWAVRRTGK